MNPENRNMILAISLSMAVLFGWQVFVVGPELEKEAALQQAIAEQEAADAANDAPQVDPDAIAAAAGSASGEITVSEAAPQMSAPRIIIDAPLVSGSISLAGLRIDDIMLKAYQETQDPGSDNIQFLLKTDSETPFFAEFGWAAAEATQPMPKADTLWTASAMVLSPGAPVTLSWDNGNGLTFRRSLAINDDYMITVEDSVESRLATPVTLFPYGLVRRHGTPPTTGIYILHEGALGVFDETLREEDYGDMRDADDGVSEIRPETSGGWIGFTDKYWLAALVPDQKAKMNFAFKSLAGPADRYQVDYIASEPTILAAGGAVSSQTRLFAGAKKVSLLDGYAEELGIANFDLAIDFGWFYFLTKPFFYAINWLNGLLGNFGLAVLAFTIVVKLVFYPLANKSYRSMGKMRVLAPKVQEIRERHSEDRMAMNQAMMALYKEEKVNPAAGCLPVLLQIPVFFALYKVLFVTIEMRHAPFFGWIIDLSAPDPTSVFNLFGLMPFSVDFLPPFLQLGAWPIMMGLSMWLQMRLNPAPPDPVQARIFQFMPIIFTFLLATFPAGLVIYWTWNNLLSMAQQWYIIRSIEKER
ncbi:MAG: membrane protein insertase YidC [Pseudomonadota bacterium]|nr:membrane protein insertase YidC [Pseudomonadota bacterium]